MSFMASIPAENMEAANASLLAGGFGGDNFYSVPLRPDGSTGDATRASCHHQGNDPAFRAALAALPGVVMGDDVAFASFVTGQGLEWTDPTNWFVSPIMIGDQRTYASKLWESLVDFNVWTPPVAWREVATNPAWVQPTGAHDAYALGATVTHNGQVWTSLFPANVWEPGVFGWEVVP